MRQFARPWCCCYFSQLWWLWSLWSGSMVRASGGAWSACEEEAARWLSWVPAGYGLATGSLQTHLPQACARLAGVIDSHEAARDAGASTERRKLTYEEFVNECVTCLRAVFPDPSKVAQVNDVLSAGYMGCVAALPSTLDQVSMDRTCSALCLRTLQTL